MEMLAAFGDRAGRERARVVLADEMIPTRRGSTSPRTRCAAGRTRTPAEATDRRLELGDLVYVDTDTVGIEALLRRGRSRWGRRGLLPEQRDAYRASYEWLRPWRR